MGPNAARQVTVGAGPLRTDWGSRDLRPACTMVSAGGGGLPAKQPGGRLFKIDTPLYPHVRLESDGERPVRVGIRVC
jgi:hypothetical protein